MSVPPPPIAQLVENKKILIHKGNKLVAILLGVGVNLGLIVTGFALVSVAIACVLLHQGVTPGQLEGAVLTFWPAMLGSPLGFGLSLFAIFASFFSGYLAARFANDRELLIAVVLMGVCFVLSMLAAPLILTEQHWLFAVICVGGIVPGAWTYLKKKREIHRCLQENFLQG